MTAAALFEVSCRRCGRTLLPHVARIADPELAQLEGHVRACEPECRLERTPGIAAILDHFRVRQLRDPGP